MSQLSAFVGVLRYEFMMQVRRPALWITAVLVAAFVFRSFRSFFLTSDYPTTAMSVGSWAEFFSGFYPLAAGLLLADRFVRDQKVHVDEVLATTTADTGTRLWGKFAGTVLATLVPGAIIYLCSVVVILVYRQDASQLGLALLAFLATTCVAVIFVGAFTLACTTVMWPVLYQFLFVGYWFWGNLLSPQKGIPTLNGTLLTPRGDFILAGLFPQTVQAEGQYHALTATLAQGIGSLAALLGCAVVVQLVAWRGLVWREAHR